MGWWTRLRASIAALFTDSDSGAHSARWTHQSGAPQFRLEPTVNHLPDGQTVRLLMTFTQISGRDVGASLRARWRGAGTDAYYAIPLVDIREHTYQTKVVLADPEQTSDPEIEAQHIGFELAFELDEFKRHFLWIWPLFKELDGRWSLRVDSASIGQPAQCW